MSTPVVNATSQANQNNQENDKELPVAIVALVISVVALLASLLQVAQQYYASAAGYANCDEKVMGKWHVTKKRRLRPYEFRFEVQFEAPVIFLCPPTNKLGPVKGHDIIFLTGDEDSRKKSKSELQADGKPQDLDEVLTDKERIHTADNERASWVTLLSALQRMEYDSRTWQREQYQRPHRPPRRDSSPTLKSDELDPLLEGVAKNYTLTAALQPKAKSWDTMPSSVKRPYATTTWCHMVEMLALLGVYWIEFDRSHDRYRGEGNGYVVTGEKVSDLGVMFTFQVYGKSRFADNRVIPVDEVKELCFGFVPTLYRATSDARRLKFPNDEPRDLSVLQLASRDEIAETLVLIGCNTNTVNYFLKEKKRDAHLFPVAFEILGMLGRTLHIENSCFRALPNPTFYRWDTKNFSLSKMLDSFLEQAETPNVLKNQNSTIVKRIKAHINKIKTEVDLLSLDKDREGLYSLTLLGALHRALDDMDEVLTAREKNFRPPITREATQASAAHERNDSHSKLLEKDPKKMSEKPHEKERRQMVQDVLRSHVQEVLRGINETDKAEEDAQPHSPTVPWLHMHPKLPLPRFKEIDDAAPEDKQAKLMEVYFHVVRQKVVDRAEKSATKRRESTASPPGTVPTQGIQKRPTEKSIVEHAAEDDEESGATETADSLWDLPDVKHEDIWCTLVFRMICWLMLHDFHKKDVQISKSELLGSRLPVYIA